MCPCEGIPQSLIDRYGLALQFLNLALLPDSLQEKKQVPTGLHPLRMVRRMTRYIGNQILADSHRSSIRYYGLTALARVPKKFAEEIVPPRHTAAIFGLVGVVRGKLLVKSDGSSVYVFSLFEALRVF